MANIPPVAEILADPIWKRVLVDGDCWIWTGARTTHGYGRVGYSGYVHRRVAEMVYGPIPAGMYVCHTCDNPPCCRPDHLFIGTQKDNMQDRGQKGRSAAVLARDEVVQARALSAAGMTITAIATQMGRNRGTIAAAVIGDSWKGIPDARPRPHLYFKWLRKQAGVIQARRRSGVPFKTIRRELGIGEQTLYRLLAIVPAGGAS